MAPLAQQLTIKASLASVARWLATRPAKSRHQKLLDPAKKHVTNFQLKSA